MEKEDDEPIPPRTGGSNLTLILGLSIALVTAGIGWVCWTCIDSLQSHEGKLHNFHVTADNTKIDSHHLDIFKNDIDSKVSVDKMSPSLDLQTVLVKQDGSELIYNEGLTAFDEKQYDKAIGCFTKVLSLIPAEAKRKSTWFASGDTVDRVKYTMWCYRHRGNCHKLKKDFSKAVADYSDSIKQMPEIAVNYQKRAELYYLLGKKALGDADSKKAEELIRRNHTTNDPAPQQHGRSVQPE
jgi:tetratricopeptide (TPR) repeat protein